MPGARNPLEISETTIPIKRVKKIWVFVVEVHRALHFATGKNAVVDRNHHGMRLPSRDAHNLDFAYFRRF